MSGPAISRTGCELHPGGNLEGFADRIRPDGRRRRNRLWRTADPRGHIGFSAMMHGYLAFDKSGELLGAVPHLAEHQHPRSPREAFRAVPVQHSERWSVAHLYQAVLNHEEHVSRWTTSPHSPGTCTGSSPARRCSAWATPPACSPSTRPPIPTKPNSSSDSTRSRKSPRSRGS